MSNEENKTTEIEYDKNGEKKKISIDLSTLTKPPKELEVEVKNDDVEALQRENEELKSALSTIAEKELEAKKKALNLSGKIDDLPIDEQIPIVKYEEMKRVKANEPPPAPRGGTTALYPDYKEPSTEKEYDMEKIEDVLQLKADIEKLKNEGKISQDDYQKWWRNMVKSGIKQSREQGTEFEISTIEEKDEKGRPYKRLTAKMVPKGED
jgi:hypothetical protein